MDPRDQKTAQKANHPWSHLSGRSGGDTRSPRRTDGLADTDGPQDAIQAFYARLGGFIVRFRYLVVAVWLLVAVAANVGLPSLSSVTNNDTSAFLPSSQPSLRAARLAAPFQHGTLPQAVLVAFESNGPLTAADDATIARVEAAVRRVPGVVDLRDQGTSRDGRARKAQITLTGDAQGTGAN
jgi:RND superfamily putative drug exporter